MNDTQPNERHAGALALAEVVRRKGREHRIAQARQALLLAETYERPLGWIANVLDILPSTLDQLLAADGVHRCVECCHGFHRVCMRELSFEPNGIPIPCECGCLGSTRRV